MLRLLALAASLVLACAQACAGQAIQVPTRPGITSSVFWEAQEGATATVLLFPGGEGGFGKMQDGRPGSGNFLVRSVQHFLDDGFNVAIFGRPSDHPGGLQAYDRLSSEHAADVRAVIEWVRQQSKAPVWLVGTSMGTVSATAAAIALQDAGISGVVLTSSIVAFDRRGAVPTQDLAAIRVPVLVVHHAKDSCKACPPHDVPYILRGLKNAPIKKEVTVTTGANPAGDECGPFHWHGYIGAEKETVDLIARWMAQPAN